MTVRRILIALSASAAFALSLGASPAAASSSPVTYSASGAFASACAHPLDVGCLDPARAYTYTGTASCAQNCTGAPPSGSFEIRLTSSRLFPPVPFFPPGPFFPGVSCAAKDASGSFSVTWSDATTTTGTVSGHSEDGHGLRLKGQITGGTNTFYPPEPFRGFVSYPSNPCNPGTFTGSLVFYPPQPV
jgi:hypothetical protein